MFPEGVRDLKRFEFKVIKGNLPKWLSKKDLLFIKNIFKLKQD
jgi:hypothetical protein